MVTFEHARGSGRSLRVGTVVEGQRDDQAARTRLVSRLDMQRAEPNNALAYAFDIVLRGRSDTPFEENSPMSRDAKLIPTSSQTVGPYFRIGLEYLLDYQPSEPDAAGWVSLCGAVFDRDGAPVPDAMLEFWSAHGDEVASHATSRPSTFPDGFRRAATDLDGGFSIAMPRPAIVAMQAPHLLVLVFARGLLRNLISRVYFDDEPGNLSDPVLLAVPAERRRTLIARREGNAFRWDLHLQGSDETVFFAW